MLVLVELGSEVVEENRGEEQRGKQGIALVEVLVLLLVFEGDTVASGDEGRRTGMELGKAYHRWGRERRSGRRS